MEHEPRGEAEVEEERIEDLDVRDEQADEVAGGYSGSSGDVLPTEQISLRR